MPRWASIPRVTTSVLRAMSEGMSGYRVLHGSDAHWRPSNQMGVLNTDLAKQLEVETLGARLWRLRPGQASTRHRHRDTAELYVVLESAGRMRVGDEALTLEPPERGLRGAGRGAPAVQRHRRRPAVAGGGRTARGGEHARDDRRGSGLDLSRRTQGDASGAGALDGRSGNDRRGSRLRTNHGCRVGRCGRPLVVARLVPRPRKEAVRPRPGRGLVGEGARGRRRE